MPVHELTTAQREFLLDEVLDLFILFCEKEFKRTLYRYQLRVAKELLRSLFVEPKDVYVKIARQAGKTEVVTLLLRFLLVYYRAYFGTHLMAAVASPQGEQAKTDIDRIKLSIPHFGKSFGLIDTENNTKTIRAERHGHLTCEMYLFSLKPTSNNESKPLNLLVLEEGQDCPDEKRSKELDPMLASTGGPTWYIGVGCTQLCDFKRGCDGQLPDSVAVVVDVEEVIRDRRQVYEKTGDEFHLRYEVKTRREIAKKGRQNPQIRRNYYLEDTVETGNFVSRERFLKCGRVGMRKNGLLVPCDDLVFAIDWARDVDWTWTGVMNRNFDLLGMWKYPHVRYEEQMDLMLTDLKTPRKWLVMRDGREVEETFTFFERINTVRGDSTGKGDFPMEYMQGHSGLPIGEESCVEFTVQAKNEMYSELEAAIFRGEGEQKHLSYPADHPLAAELEEQMCNLLRAYKTDKKLLSPHAPEKPGFHDDACSMLALCALGAARGFTGQIVFL